MPFRYLFLFFAVMFSSCDSPPKSASLAVNTPSETNGLKKPQEELSGYIDGEPITTIATGTTTPAELITYARTLNGVPYKYGSTKPEDGFDCSGFITYVFNHFKIAVPRRSVDFTNVKHEVPLKDAKPGDLVLFTGTDSTENVVGHMGILISMAAEGPTFIHSTSGKAYGVTETPLNPYYQGRFVKVVRVFPQNDQ